MVSVGALQILTQGQTLVVSAAKNPAGAAVTLFSDAGLSSAVTLPLTVAADTTLWGRDAPVDLVVTCAGFTVFSGRVFLSAASPAVVAPRLSQEQLSAIASGLNGTYAAILGPGSIAATATSVAAGEDTIFRTCEYRGVVYVGAGWSQGGGTLGGKLYTMNPVTRALTLAADTGKQSIRSLAVYRGVLYVGTGIGGRVYSWDGSTLTEVFNSGIAGGSHICMTVYKGKLYIGETASGKVYSFDGTTWATAVTTGDTHIESLNVWNGLLVIGTGNAGAHHVFAYDGTNSGVIYTGANSNKQEALSVTPWRGRLYVTEFDPTGTATLEEFSLETGRWSAYSIPTGNGGVPTAVYSSAVYRDALYLGSHPYGSLYSFDGATVRYEGAATGMQSLRDITIYDDRIIVSGRASGTPATGGAVFTYGDSGRRPVRTNELPRSIPVATNPMQTWVGTFDPKMISAALAIPSNRAYYNRVRVPYPKFITGLKTSIGTQSGNICVGVHAADGAAIGATGVNGPGTLLATSGSVACPTSGTQSVAFTAGMWCLPGVDYWFAVAADNGTATFNALNPTTVISDLSAYQDTAFPLPATASGTTGLSGRQYPLWAY